MPPCMQVGLTFKHKVPELCSVSFTVTDEHLMNTLLLQITMETAWVLCTLTSAMLCAVFTEQCTLKHKSETRWLQRMSGFSTHLPKPVNHVWDTCLKIMSYLITSHSNEKWHLFKSSAEPKLARLKIYDWNFKIRYPIWSLTPTLCLGGKPSQREGHPAQGSRGFSTSFLLITRVKKSLTMAEWQSKAFPWASMTAYCHSLFLPGPVH